MIPTSSWGIVKTIWKYQVWGGPCQIVFRATLRSASPDTLDNACCGKNCMRCAGPRSPHRRRPDGRRGRRCDRLECHASLLPVQGDQYSVPSVPHGCERSPRAQETAALLGPPPPTEQRHAAHVAHRTVMLRPVGHIQWAFDATDPMRAHVGIACGGSDGAVSEQSLNDSEIGPGFQEVSGKGVS